MMETEDYGLERLVDPPQYRRYCGGDWGRNLGGFKTRGHHHEDAAEEKD